MKNTKILVICALTVTFLALSCSIREVPSAAPILSKDIPTTTDALAKEAWETKWEEVLRGAKKEGKVVVFIGQGGEIRDILVKEFTKKYGLKLESISGPGAEFATRIMAERRAELYNLDVYQSGITTALLTLKPAGVLSPLEPALILPEVINPKAWWKGDIHWVDRERLVLNFLAYPSIPLAINTSLVRSEEIKSYNDLLPSKWKGKITMNDSTQAGPGGNLVGVQGDHIMGYDWLRQLAKQEPIITRDRRLQIQWLAMGKYSIAVSPDPIPMVEMQKEGAPIMGVTPLEGTHITGGTGSLGLIDRAPHPNAAILFINWLLSREGQEIYTRVSLAQSGRVDIPTDFLPQDRVRQPGVNYVDQASEAIPYSL